VKLSEDLIEDVSEITSNTKLQKTLASLSPDAWEVANLKTKGMSLHKIYLHFGGQYTMDEINYMLKQVVSCNAALAIKNPEILRQMLIDKLDDIELRLNESSCGELDAKTAMALLRAIDSKAKLLGLNAPEKVEVNVNHSIKAANETLKEKLDNMRKFTPQPEIIDAEVVESSTQPA